MAGALSPGALLTRPTLRMLVLRSSAPASVPRPASRLWEIVTASVSQPANVVSGLEAGRASSGRVDPAKVKLIHNVYNGPKAFPTSKADARAKLDIPPHRRVIVTVCRLLVWQSEGDAYDRRLYFGAAPASAPPAKPDPAEAWGRLWGTPGVRDPRRLDLTRTLDGPRWPLERLALPRGVTQGADLDKLGLLKKAAKPLR